MNRNIGEMSMMFEDTTRECPYCKEEIKPDAVRCKHCRSAVSPQKPPHGGVCPYCKEEIQPEAIKCKHCGSMVGTTLDGEGSTGCAGCGGSQQSAGGLPAKVVAGLAASGNPVATGGPPADLLAALAASTAQPVGTDLASVGIGSGQAAAPVCGPCDGRTVLLNGPVKDPRSYRYARKCSFRFCLPFVGCQTVEYYEPCGFVFPVAQ